MANPENNFKIARGDFAKIFICATTVTIGRLALPILFPETPPNLSDSSSRNKLPAERYVVPEKKPTEIPQLTTAAANFIVEKPNLYLPADTKEFYQPDFSKPITILGFGKNYRFKAQDPLTKMIFEVPITQVEIIEGEPLKKIVPDENFGIRNDNPELMSFVKEIGAGRIRIAVEEGNLTPQILQTIQESVKQKLRILLVFNPKELLPSDEIGRRLQGLFSITKDYQNIDLELGNEPDHASIPFWKDRNLQTFAEFVKLASEEAWKIKPDMEIVIGALVDIKNTASLWNFLQEQNAPIDKLNIAVHAYNTPEEVASRIAHTKKIIPRPIWLTELGVQGKNKGNIIEMLSTAQNNNVPISYIHELPNWEDFGYINHQKNRPTPSFYLIQCHTQLKGNLPA